MLEFIAVTEAAPWAFWLGLVVLVVLGTARLTRLVTADHLGAWWRASVEAWADDYERSALQLLSLPPETTPREVLPHQRRVARRVSAGVPVTWPKRLAIGLACPFCVGFWIGALVLLVTLALVWAPAWAAGTWLVVLGVLALNYLTAHLGARLD